jgi:hypothetical protein
MDAGIGNKRFRIRLEGMKLHHRTPHLPRVAPPQVPQCVTYVSGIFCNPCVGKHRPRNWRGGQRHRSAGRYGDTTSMIETLIEAADQVERALPNIAGIEEVIGDKGYHSTERIVDLERLGLRSYISEPKRGQRRWRENHESRDAVYRNRSRIGGNLGKPLLRLRGERLERPFAHLYETGRMRRTHLCGRDNILKRVLVHVSALNLGLLRRTTVGVGTPRSLQGLCNSLFSGFSHFVHGIFLCN